jgi:hypothetical protein
MSSPVKNTTIWSVITSASMHGEEKEHNMQVGWGGLKPGKFKTVYE